MYRVRHQHMCPQKACPLLMQNTSFCFPFVLLVILSEYPSVFLSTCGAHSVNMKVFMQRFSGERDSALEKVDMKCLYRDNCNVNLY